MTKHSKAYRAAAAKLEPGRFYSPEEAVTLARETGSARFDSTVEVALKLGVDVRKADQIVRGTVSLPHGTGKTARVIVFATGPAAEAARRRRRRGRWRRIHRQGGGRLHVVRRRGRDPRHDGQGRPPGRVLGPRGLMPNPRTGTVTPDAAGAVSEIKGGRIEFRTDKHSNVHLVVGKSGFTQDALNENLKAAIDEIVRLKPPRPRGVHPEGLGLHDLRPGHPRGRRHPGLSPPDRLPRPASRTGCRPRVVSPPSEPPSTSAGPKPFSRTRSPVSSC